MGEAKRGTSLRFALKILGPEANSDTRNGDIADARRHRIGSRIWEGSTQEEVYMLHNGRRGFTETDWWDAVGTKDNIGSSASSTEGIKCGNLVVVGLSERVVPGWTSLLMNIMPMVISC
ncbi:hypothetical protein C4D60_Mb08t15180 [Musa balbisiana]|uniref:Uncharacterized protein n=1 Tax=Musa balbisiana TaxID=52838 RepID=A0A4S8K3Y9_MUSBA|nr:hypothetical protein C4D60_Mb08t15180 [Musa balbisiana]